jgi:hypothetical protein
MVSEHYLEFVLDKYMAKEPAESTLQNEILDYMDPIRFEQDQQYVVL